MTHKQNGKQQPFKIGQKVRHLSDAADQSVRTVVWVSKGATCRADQIIATDWHDRANPSVGADIYTLAV